MSESIRTELYQQRLATDMTGLMTDLQVKHLKVWFLGAAHHVEKGQFEIHLNIPDKSLIYAIKSTTGLPDGQFGTRMDYLAKCVHLLLGETWLISAVQDGKTIYVGTRVDKPLNYMEFENKHNGR